MDETYKLIKSLTPGEIKSFKSYAEKSESKIFLKIFDFMNSSKEYNEETASEKIDITPKQYSNMKWYLYEVILKYLERSKRKSSVTFEVRSLLNEAEILYTKSLYKASRKKLNKALSLCRKHELFSYELEIHYQLTKIDRVEVNLVNIEKKIESGFSDETNTINKYLNNFELSKCFSAGFYAEYKFGWEKPDILGKEFEKILSHPIIQNPELAQSYKAKRTLYQLLTTYNYITNNLANSSKYLDELIKIIEKEQITSQETLSLYIDQLLNKLSVTNYLKDETEFQKLLNKIRTLPDTYKKLCNDYLLANIFADTVIIELQFHIDNKKYSSGLEKLKHVSKSLDSGKYNISQMQELYIYFYMGLIYMICGYHNQALTCINKIINTKKTKTAESIIYKARICSLILHYELGNYIYIENSLASAERLLDKKDKYYKLEKFVYKTFRNFLKKHKPGSNSLFAALKEEINLKVKEEYEVTALNETRFNQWIESKIMNKPLTEF